MAGSSAPFDFTNAVHLCVDMQMIFARGGVWETPWMDRVLPLVERIASRHRERTIFTRFITPERPEDRPGRWQAYYRKWHRATRTELVSGALDLVPSLARLAPPAFVIDKPAYSGFTASALPELLTEKKVATLVMTGAETDVCVLATALDAVDFGFAVVLVEDALCSSSDTGHDALMTMYRERFSEQIALMPAAEVLDRWRA